MRRGNYHSIVLKDPRFLVFGILHLVPCIICVLVVARRIRHRQHRKPLPFEGQMDSPSQKGGGKANLGAAGEGETLLGQQSDDPPPFPFTPFPSACDILQPLSHLSPLPSSGYLAAALSHERGNRVSQVYQQVDYSHSGSGQTDPPDSEARDSESVIPLRTNRTRRNSSSGVNNSLLLAGDPSLAASLQGWSAEGYDQEPADSPNSDEIQSVQKRSHTVHFLHDVDEQGPRTWRRWVVEYS